MARYCEKESVLSCAVREYSRNLDSRKLSETARKMNADGCERSLSLLLMRMLAPEDPELYSALGDRYFQGNGVREDKAKSLDIFREAAEQGSTRSMYDLAWYYYDRREFLQAIDYFQRCVNAPGDLDPAMVGKSYSTLGSCYASLPAPKIDLAVEALTIGAEKYRDSFAARMLGFIYGKKDSRQFSTEKSLHYLEQAARDGDIIAAEKLGSYYFFGNTDLGIQPDGRRAEAVMLPYADGESALLLRLLGMLYLLGGRNGEIQEDYGKAREFLERSLRLEYDARTEADLGYAYFKLGLFQQAEALLVKADENDIVVYSDFLGRIYKDGFLGVPDQRKALRYYAHAFSSRAMNNLFTCVEYAVLLEDTGDYQNAYAVMAYGHGKYNDAWFIFNQARLVLEGRVTNQISLEEAAHLMEVCIYNESHTQEAHLALGHYYLQTFNYRLAEEHYLEAFHGGNADAAVYLGRLYEAGGGTIKASPNMAYEWFARAAAAGSARGQREKDCFRKGLLGGWKRVSNII